ncbi:acyltransferase family protein [Roseibium aggregatum]|uniref:Acyltransferase n=1 Tax=Roseibium aggregatum TaxID=187304 RepID=A0A939J4W4_9HYPH|nr:acyltransferase family protein [Roseibium aggregatum]MBN9671595.1 acyltransferase [Roseibium aggregatum]
MKYRADIDGLRAVAVVSVVVYHVGNSVGFNGYLGVDVFFVISGYLIAGILLSDLQEGRFSFIDFYMRRARRILPALLTVITVTCIAASAVLLPNEALPFARSVFAALFFYSNFLFYSEAGYFDASADLKPLLHTWSLSVEEQFYLVFPVLLLAGFRRGVGFLKVLIPSIVVLSLVWNLSFPAVFKDQDFAFFMFPVRAWELLSGAVLALFGRPKALSAKGLANGLSLCGLILIVLGFAIALPDDFPYVLKTFPVVLGTGLIILSGSGTCLPVVNQVLGTKGFLFFGKISYSLYLWHWPLYVFFLYYNFGRLSDFERTLIGLLSVALSYVTWRFVEQPFRRKPFPDLLPALRLSLVPFAVVLAFAGYTVTSRGVLPWTDANFQRFVNVEFGGDFQNETVGGLEVQALGAPPGNGAAAVALLGDSHAQAITPAVHDLSAEAGLSSHFFRSQCIAIEDELAALDYFADCVALTRQQAGFIAQSPDYKTVIIAGRWLAKTKFWAGKAGLDMQKTWALRESSLLNLVQMLTDSGKTVVVLAQVPLIETRFKRSLPSVVSRMIRQDHPDLKEMSPTREHYLKKNGKVLEMLDRISRRTGATLVLPHETLCPGSNCLVYDDKGMIYWDDDHLSEYGARKIKPLFAPFFDHSKSARAGGSGPLPAVQTPE